MLLKTNRCFPHPGICIRPALMKPQTSSSSASSSLQSQLSQVMMLILIVHDLSFHLRTCNHPRVCPHSQRVTSAFVFWASWLRASSTFAWASMLIYIIPSARYSSSCDNFRNSTCFLWCCFSFKGASTHSCRRSSTLSSCWLQKLGWCKDDFFSKSSSSLSFARPSPIFDIL